MLKQLTSIPVGILLVLSLSASAKEHQGYEPYLASLKTWITAVHSLDVTYHFSEDGRPGVDSGPIRTFDAQYRWREGDIYFDHTVPDDDGSPMRVQHALLHGVYTARIDRQRSQAREENGEIDTGGKRWGLPPFVFLMPHEFWNPSVGKKRLTDALDYGTNYLFQVEGRAVLSHWSDDLDRSDEFDVWFDEEGRVERIESVLRFGIGSSEKVAAIWDGDLFDFRHVFWRIEYTNYMEIDSVEIPTTVRMQGFPNTNEASRQVMAAYDRGELDFSSYVVAFIKASPKNEVRFSRTSTIDVSTARVNHPLGDEAFTITWGAGAVITNRETGHTQHVHSLWERLLTLPSLVFGGVIAVLMCASFVAWRYWERIPV